MIQNVNFGLNNIKNISFKSTSVPVSENYAQNNTQNATSLPFFALPSFSANLSPQDEIKYCTLVKLMADYPISLNSENMSVKRQLDYLLKNGKLLSRSNHDNSTVLDNLYDIAMKPRIYNINQKKIISDTLDILVNPRYVTQNFGDIPLNEKQNLIYSLPDDNPVKQSPRLMDVTASATCAAASIEVNMADKYPAEFARWVSKLSDADDKLSLYVNLDSISKNKLDAADILNLFSVKNNSFNFRSKNSIEVTPDTYAPFRAAIQDKYWDYGERNTADTFVQSAIMQIGSQNTYDSLTDTRACNFSEESQGLVEIEKTFVESLIKNKEITSLIYQKVDEDGNLVGYNCPLEKIQKHILDTIDSGEDVILGYVLTNETADVCKNKYYNPQVDGAPNKIISGHEITIVNYEKDPNGNVSFICIDTDDDNPEYVEYSADWLLPKIHHAGYPAQLVKDDEQEIMKNAELI